MLQQNGIKQKRGNERSINHLTKQRRMAKWSLITKSYGSSDEAFKKEKKKRQVYWKLQIKNREIIYWEEDGKGVKKRRDNWSVVFVKNQHVPLIVVFLLFACCFSKNTYFGRSRLDRQGWHTGISSCITGCKWYFWK